MPKIRIPDDVTVTLMGNSPDKDDAHKVTFVRDFVVRMLLADQKWGASTDELFAAMDLRGAFLGKAPGDLVEIGKDHHSRMVERMRNPSSPYVPIVAVQLGTFFDAILEPAEA